MRIKPDVRLLGLRPEMIIAVLVAKDVYDALKAEFVITSGIEGKHQRGSLHYAGCAIDIRTNNLQNDEKKRVADDIRDRLTDDFDVVLGKQNIHIEFQPKNPY